MFEREIERYNTLLREYKTTVIDKFNVEDLKEYNEILFSAHSCAIEGNTFSVDDTRALKEKGLRPKHRTEPGTTCGLCSQFDGLRDGCLPVGDGHRHGAILTYETCDIGRDTVVAVAQDLARGLARQLHRVGHLRAVVRGRAVAVQIVCSVDFQQHTVSCR